MPQRAASLLIGALPTAYALNRTLSESDSPAFIQTMQNAAVCSINAVATNTFLPWSAGAPGASQGPAATFDSRAFFRSGGVRLYGLMLFHELRTTEPASEGLAILAGMIASGALRPRIEIEADWAELGAVARRLLDRSFVRKAVLYVR